MLQAIMKIIKKDEAISGARDATAVSGVKQMYSTWDCGRCAHAFYYTVLRCPLCESTRIKKHMHPVKLPVHRVVFAEEKSQGWSDEIPLLRNNSNRRQRHAGVRGIPVPAVRRPSVR
ncbi:MAG: hypothetical protein HYY37_03775 [Candidatus Aenigmarchaeota archaeon]|nr:hypothetical protein [Candidatus Aenigmarchaeota archaeon]